MADPLLNQVPLAFREAPEGEAALWREAGKDATQVHRLRISLIYVPPERRPIEEAAVAGLMESIREMQGLINPISVRRRLAGDPDGAADYVLVTGHHRLTACRRLGWTYIPVVYGQWDERESRIREISENLHRAELTQLERDKQLAEWLRLVQGEVEAELSSQPATNPARGRPKDGIREAARRVGVSKDDAFRAIKVASLTVDAQARAVELGLDDNRAALLEIAKAPASEQVETTEQIAQRKDAGPDMADPDEPEALPYAKELAKIFMAYQRKSLAMWIAETDNPERRQVLEQMLAATAAENMDAQRIAQGFWDSFVDSEIDATLTDWQRSPKSKGYRRPVTMRKPDLIGAPTTRKRRSRQAEHGLDPDSAMIDEMARRTGASTERIRASLQLAEDADRAGVALWRIEGTSLDDADELKALFALPAPQREKLVDRAAAGETVSALQS